jgi:hypothetical protein
MEYLMTYGWAILIISVVLASLFSLGIFSISKVSGNSCVGSVGYLCSNPQLMSNGLLLVTIGQLGKGSLTVTGLGCSNTTAFPSTLTSTSFALQPAQSMSIPFSCNLPSSTIGSGFSGTLWFQYNQGGQTGLISQVGAINTQVTQVGTTSSSPTLYTVTFDSGAFIGNIVANGVIMNNGATGTYTSGSTIPVDAILSSEVFSSWSVSRATNLIVGSYTTNPTTLTINGIGTLTATGTCFVWGTPILTPNGSEPIQDIKVGTIVYSFNSASDKVVYSRVVQTFVKSTYYTYTLNTSFGRVITTGSHLFYTGNGTFVQARNLSVGDKVGVYQNDTIIFTKILSIEISFAPQPVYNLEVNDTHTYFASGFAVHNACP